MSDLVRDTLFGHFIRLVTKQKYLQYAEEKDSRLWKQYLDRDRTLNMAMYGHPDLSPEEQKEKDLRFGSNGDSGDDEDEQARDAPAKKRSAADAEGEKIARAVSKQTTHEHQLHSALTNQRVDTEKGRDAAMIGWFGDDDPEVRWMMLSFSLALQSYSRYGRRASSFADGDFCCRTR